MVPKMKQQKQLTIKLPPLHPGQREVQQSEARFKVLSCGRRWGKSRLASALLLARALQGGNVWWVAPSYATGQIGFDEIRRLAQQLPHTEINRSERFVKVAGGGRVTVRSADDPNSLRGFSLDLVVVDEAAYVPRLQELWQEVLRPALADREGSAVFCSTPKGKNFFWTLYSQGLDPLQPDWQSWQFPTSSNPFIPQGEIDAMKASMPDAKYQQEVLAQFVESGTVFRNVNELMKPEYRQSGPILGHEYTVGVDVARASGGDYTVFAVYDCNEGDICTLERFSGTEYSVQVARLVTLVEKWRPVATVIETNGMGQALLEQAQPEIRRASKVRPKGHNTTNASKSEMVNQLILACEREEVGFLDDDILKTELMAFEATDLPSGLTRYSAPSGQHDDTVMAVLLAFNAGQFSGPIRRYRGARAGRLTY